MDEKFEQCAEKKSSESSSSDISSCNQEPSDDMKKQVSVNAEARKIGKTPSSCDLPKIDIADFMKWESVVAQAKPQMSELSSPPKDGPVCKDEPESRAAEAQGKQPESTNTDAEGRVVREKYAGGPDIVVAYDDKGEPHKFVDSPVKEMPPDFKQVPDWREKQLQQDAEDLLRKYAEGKTAGDTEHLDFQKVADMQKEIAHREDLTETEKCLLYTKAQNIMHDKPITIENWNEKPEMIDSWSGQGDPWHAVAPLDDRYHNRLVNMKPEEASAKIFEQEDHSEGDMHPTWFGKTAWKVARAILDINTGDINASEGQLKAMRQLREKGTFAAYADEWEKQFVNKQGLDPRRGQAGAGYE